MSAPASFQCAAFQDYTASLDGQFRVLYALMGVCISAIDLAGKRNDPAMRDTFDAILQSLQLEYEAERDRYAMLGGTLSDIPSYFAL